MPDRAAGGRRLGFRAQLAALIALSIGLCGAAAALALYVVVANELQVVEVSATDAQPPGDGSGSVSVTRTAVLEQTLIWLGAILVVLLVAATALGWWLSGRLLGRVRAITGAARTVAEGDLSARLALTGPRDEITELGDTFDQMLDRLDRAMTAQRTFVANASHELRTPLASGRIALEAPLEQGRLDGDGQIAAQRALASIDRASMILTGLLELATVTDAPVAREPVDLAELAAEAAEEVGPDAASRGQRLHLDRAPSPALGDPVLVGRAVTNLLRNAVVHSPDGALITVTTGHDGDRAVLRVENPGAELDPEEVRALVAPFHRGARSRLVGAGGSGLGLAIVDAVAARFGGDLQVHARSGGGLTATMALPAPGRSATRSPAPRGA